MSQKIRTVYLVDGSSYIHRAYHAIRNLSNSKGFPTNAVFGFTKMVLKLMNDKSPDYLALVFDSKWPTFRHDIYKDYKANRPPMPEDMAVQIPVIKEILEKLSVVTLERPGYEADDIIASFARVFEEKDFKVVVVTGDKDFRQIITPNVSMWDTMKDVVTDYESMKRVYGFDPERFIDVMGLSGDTSDNIPGVPGVGEKTAVELISKYGSFENVFEHLEEISKKKLRENLKNFKDQAELSKRLVTIDRFAPINEDIESLKVGAPMTEELTNIFKELEFKGLWETFAERKESASAYSLCLDVASLNAMIGKIKNAGMVSVDTETTSQDPMQAALVGISFSCIEGEAIYIPLGHSYMGVPTQMGMTETLDVLKVILEDDKILKIGQNIKYDAEVFKRHGVDLKGIHFDTMVASYVINPGLRQHSLDSLALQYLNHKMISYSDVVGKGKANFSEVDVEAACRYSCEDADITLRLMRLLDDRLREDKNESLFFDMEMRLLPVLMDMEMAGIRIAPEIFQDMSSVFAVQLKEMEKQVYDEAGMVFNINSPQQLGYVLFEKLGLPVQKKTTKTKNYSTDVKVLKKLTAYPHKIPGLLLRYRTLSKLKSTYLDALVKMVNPTTGRIHTSFNQTVTATGRLSSSNPNLQNIPVRGEDGREIRKGFIAEKGHYLVSADYSQIELRVFAHYSNDEAFMHAFKEDEDIHTRTAAEIMDVDAAFVTSDMRRIAKAVNFGIIYGMGAKKLSDELGIDLKTARDYISAYYQRYKGVAGFTEQMIAKARKDGFVTTLFNRRRYLPDIVNSNQMIRAEAERMAVNTPIQGTAADLIKKAMINIHRRLNKDGFKTRMLLQVHDELVFEAPDQEVDRVIAMIKQEMEGVYNLMVPLKVDIKKGRNWDEAH
ncbi:DNA polymerase I [uncultured Desulfobacterium sp.]|uniref:DNA polymerase I n=1 Tax=uncultured Desulfobacterium sp. TaxID=201089 RepID=A0A445MTY6_9BACT|nr:DNA polymerase I [uncultured Desulfobacterium sp.]